MSVPPLDFSIAKLSWENIKEILHSVIIRFMDDTMRCDLRSMVQICTVAWYQKPWLLRYSNSSFLFDLTSMVFMKSPSLHGNRERKRRTVWRKSGAPRSLKWEQERRSVSMYQCSVTWRVSRCIDIALYVGYPEFYDNTQLGPVVRRLISANPGLNFNQSFLFFCLKTFFRIIFSLLSRASNE